MCAPGLTSRSAVLELDGELPHGRRPFDGPPPMHTRIFDGQYRSLNAALSVGKLPLVLMIFRKDRFSASTQFVV
jgi:hypothetical protein